MDSTRPGMSGHRGGGRAGGGGGLPDRLAEWAAVAPSSSPSSSSSSSSSSVASRLSASSGGFAAASRAIEVNDDEDIDGGEVDAGDDEDGGDDDGGGGGGAGCGVADEDDSANDENGEGSCAGASVGAGVGSRKRRRTGGKPTKNVQTGEAWDVRVRANLEPDAPDYARLRTTSLLRGELHCVHCGVVVRSMLARVKQHVRRKTARARARPTSRHARCSRCEPATPQDRGRLPWPNIRVAVHVHCHAKALRAKLATAVAEEGANKPARRCFIACSCAPVAPPTSQSSSLRCE